jgi:hypothetical protein
MTDPHRAAGCHWKGEDGISGSWISQLDWAVYHAEGWQQWQRFRMGLVGIPVKEKLSKLYQWKRAHTTVQDLIRVLNYLRSLRKEWRNLPNLKDWHGALHQQYNHLRGEKCNACDYPLIPDRVWRRIPRSERPYGLVRVAHGNGQCGICYGRVRRNGTAAPVVLSKEEVDRLRRLEGVTL